MESRSVCNSNYFIVSAIARQLKDCTAIDKENTFKIQTEKAAGQAVKACPAVCVLWQIFFRDPIPADAEGVAPLYDL